MTARRYEQLTPLVEQSRRDDILIVGEFGGASLEGKLRASVERARELLPHILEAGPDAAMSSGSPEASRIAYGLGIPHVLASDTPESPVNKLAAPVSRAVFTPWVVGRMAWAVHGVRPSDIVPYRGLDPMAWLTEFTPDRSVLAEHSLTEGSYVLVREAEFKAAYVRGYSQDSFVSFANRLPDLCQGFDVVVLPRYGDETEALRLKLDRRIRVVERPVLGPSLTYFCSLFIGGGGTMTQESALLGVPTLSIYPQTLPRVISYLVDRGMVQHLSSPEKGLALISGVMRRIDSLRKASTDKARRLRGRMENPAAFVAERVEQLL